VTEHKATSVNSNVQVKLRKFKIIKQRWLHLTNSAERWKIFQIGTVRYNWPIFCICVTGL